LEKGKTDDVIPMGMGYEYLGFNRSFWEIILRQVVSQCTDAGSGINDNEPVFFAKPEF
jgi:hypothetical protein